MPQLRFGVLHYVNFCNSRWIYLVFQHWMLDEVYFETCNRHTVEYRNLRLLYQTFNKKLLRLGEGAAFLRVWQKNIIEDDSNTRCFINTKDGTFQLQHQRKTNGKKLSKSESAFSDCFHVMPPLTNGRHGIGVPPAAQRHQWGKNGENILVIFIIAIDNLPK